MSPTCSEMVYVRETVHTYTSYEAENMVSCKSAAINGISTNGVKVDFCLE